MFEQLIAPITQVVGDVLKRVLPPEKMSDGDRAKIEAELRLALLAQENNQLEISMSAILAEAKSADPWTSRARPSFMYVIYFMILFSIPMGILSAFRPDMAIQVAVGMKSWLSAIPDMLWGVFGAGYLGYVTARSFDKKQLVGK